MSRNITGLITIGLIAIVAMFTLPDKAADIALASVTGIIGFLSRQVKPQG